MDKFERDLAIERERQHTARITTVCCSLTIIVIAGMGMVILAPSKSWGQTALSLIVPPVVTSLLGFGLKRMFAAEMQERKTAESDIISHIRGDQ